MEFFGVKRILLINPAFFGFMSQHELKGHPVDRACFDAGVLFQIRSTLLKLISRLSPFTLL